MGDGRWVTFSPPISDLRSAISPDQPLPKTERPLHPILQPLREAAIPPSLAPLMAQDILLYQPLNGNNHIAHRFFGLGRRIRIRIRVVMDGKTFKDPWRNAVTFLLPLTFLVPTDQAF